MYLFTFILDYRGGTYISQVRALDPSAAIQRRIDDVDLDKVDGLTYRSRGVFRARLGTQQPAPLNNTVNVWCVNADVRGALALVNIVRTTT